MITYPHRLISTNDDAQAALVEMGLSLIPSDEDI